MTENSKSVDVKATERQFCEWVGLNGPKPTNDELAAYLTRELENRENVDQIEYVVTCEAIAALKSHDTLRKALEGLCSRLCDINFHKMTVDEGREFVAKKYGDAMALLWLEGRHALAATLESAFRELSAEARKPMSITKAINQPDRLVGAEARIAKAEAKRERKRRKRSALSLQGGSHG